MATISFSRKEFEKHIKLSEQIQDRISMFGTPFEGMNDNEVMVEIYPNRPDLISLQGYLRSFMAFIGKKTGIREYKIKKSGYKLVVDKNTPKEWPYAYACIVRGLKFDDEKIKEVIQIQEKLGATLLRDRKKGGIGVYPLEKLEFPIKFTGMNPNEIKFRPLEFPEEITGKQILSKHATGRKYADICKDWEKLPVFVDNKGKIMSMPPIINSHTLGKIDESTKDVFIEVTGKSQNELRKAITIIATALADMGGSIESIECQQKDGKKAEIPELAVEKIKLNLENVKKTLGIEVSEKEAKKLLELMGCDYDIAKKEAIIPAWRTDIMHEVDVIEDIAIAYGYEKFEPELPAISSIGEEDRIGVLKRKVAEILIGLNFLEISTYHLLRKEDAKRAGEKNLIEVDKSKTDYSLLRKNLATSCIKVLAENVDAEYPHRIFEVGPTFAKDEHNKEESGIIEKEKIVAVVSPANFTDLKMILDYLGRMLGKTFSLEKHESSMFIDGRCGKILCNGKEAGVIGEVHPGILRGWHIKMPAALFELELGVFI